MILERIFCLNFIKYFITLLSAFLGHLIDTINKQSNFISMLLHDPFHKFRTESDMVMQILSAYAQVCISTATTVTSY